MKFLSILFGMASIASFSAMLALGFFVEYPSALGAGFIAVCSGLIAACFDPATYFKEFF